jgi:hypothetical protein
MEPRHEQIARIASQLSLDPEGAGRLRRGLLLRTVEVGGAVNLDEIKPVNWTDSLTPEEMAPSLLTRPEPGVAGSLLLKPPISSFPG